MTTKLLPLMLILSACTPTAQAAFDAATNQGVESIRRSEDTKARLVLQAPCAISTGAYFRLPEQGRLAVAILCGGNFVARLNELP